MFKGIKKYSAFAFMLSLVMLTTTNGWCVGTDLLSGASFTTLADNVLATATPIVVACLPVLGFIIALRYARKIVGLFAR